VATGFKYLESIMKMFCFLAISSMFCGIALSQEEMIYNNDDFRLRRTVRMEILGRHVHLDLATDEIDSAALGKVIRKRPATKTPQAVEGWNFEPVFDEN
jgi:hypothetical protein